MKWVKKGLIYGRSSTTPTPILLNDNTIRVYVGFRNKEGISRIGYVDVDAKNPAVIQTVSRRPVLDIGKPGTFDDNGVILGDVVKRGQKFYMYYTGFQHVQKAKFLAFSGLAVSRDGDTFVRLQDTPVIDRAPHEYYFRAIHSVLREGRHWNVWYSAGDSWEFIKGMPYPRYSIYYIRSKDGISFQNPSVLCIAAGKKEYRIGRPRVYKDARGYQMWYTRGNVDRSYLPGYAESRDGIHWTRRDREVGIAPSKSGWDSQMLCYASLLTYKKTIYMFYNGNGMGDSGFGYAILAST